MTGTSEHLGSTVNFDALDKEHVEFFRYCGSHRLHLQCCDGCGLKRCPPTTACPFCSSPDSTWQPVAETGCLYSYGEVHHAILPAFREATPYMLLLVELDEQKDTPNEFDGLRLQGNLVTENGDLAPPELVERAGIGTRLRVVYHDLGGGFAMPQWTIDDSVEQENGWRYPGE